MSTQSGAETAEDTLDALYNATTIFRSDMKIARDKSRDTLDKINTQELEARTIDPAKLQAAEEADIVAKTISDEISSIANKGEAKFTASKESLVDQLHNLSSIRVQDLLS